MSNLDQILTCGYTFPRTLCKSKLLLCQIDILSYCHWILKCLDQRDAPLLIGLFSIGIVFIGLR